MLLKARRHHMNTPPMSPRDGNFGRQYPPQDHGRRPDMGYEQHMAEKMSRMDMNQRPVVPPNGRSSIDTPRSQGDYGRRPENGGRGPPPRGHPQGEPSRQNPTYGAQGGYGNIDDRYHNPQEPPVGGFGPPARSQTMPVDEMRTRNMLPPQRIDTMQHSTPAGRGIPQRPSTAGGHRPPPQRSYPAGAQGGPVGHYNGEYDDRSAYQKPSTASYDEVYDAYFDNSRNSNQDYGQQSQQSRTSLPDFGAAPAPGQRDSFEQSMRPSNEQPQRVAHQTAVLNHAKSQPMLRQPQAAVFEMAGDVPDVPAVPPVPPVPPLPSTNNYQAGYEQNYNQMPHRGPSAPPTMAMNSSRAGGPVSPDGLPSHPAPIRPGLMQDSMIQMGNKPAPVRNYGVSTPAPTPQPQAQYQPQPEPQRQPQYQQQAQPQPQPQRSPPRNNVPQQPAMGEGPVTTQQLEHLRMLIKTNSSDQDSALKLAKKLIEAAEVLAPRMPDPKQRTRARERYLIDCHKILKKLANAQNPDAMFLLADCLGRGLFGEGDYKEAFTQYQSAAKLGHPAAAYRTAVCCEIGHEDGGGTRKDPMKAIQWYKRAATLGDPPAMYKVGMILLKGLLGQPRNPREAVGWLKRAAERADAENPHALHELGLLYESAQPNDAIIRDEAYAYSLFLQAADLGYKFSQYRLGCAFEYGLLGCPIDPRQSIQWYSRAATQEEHQAELALSGWYLTGSEGVLGQSDTEAYLWARKAAVAGLAKAEYAMGYFTEVGIGVPANLEDAKRWYWRAAGKCDEISIKYSRQLTIVYSSGLPQGSRTPRGPQTRRGQERAPA
jgi:TPR repeat protein